jgi:hypothetical protein
MRSNGRAFQPIHLSHSSLLTDSLRQIQHGNVDLVDVAQSVSRTVQFLQEFFVA